MTARESLLQVRALDREVKSRLEQLQDVRALAQGMQALRSKERGAWKGDMELQLLREVDKLLGLKQELDSAITELKSPEYRILLRLRYLCGNSWEEIAKKMHYSVTHVHRLHKQALDKFSASAAEAGKSQGLYPPSAQSVEMSIQPTVC